MPTAKVIQLNGCRKDDERNPFKNRELYIVGGDVGSSRKTDTVSAKIAVLQRSLVRSIAIEMGCRGYYEEGISVKDARILSGIISGLENNSDEMCQEVLESLRQCHTSISRNDLPGIVRMLLAVRNEGVGISMLGLEDVDDPLNALESRIPNAHFDALFLIMEDLMVTFGEEEGKEIMCGRLNEIEGLSGMVKAYRNSFIVPYILGNAIGRNVMLVDSTVALDGLEDGKNGFVLHRADFLTDGIRHILLRGTLPESLREPVTRLLAEEPFLALKMEFIDRSSSR